MRTIDKNLILSIVILSCIFLSGSTIAATEHPSPSDYNEECVLDHDLWALFSSIGGFSNSPNNGSALGSSGESSSMEITLSTTGNLSHTISLGINNHEFIDPEDGSRSIGETVSVQHILRNGSTSIVNQSLSMISMPSFSGYYYSLTGFLTHNDTLNIFWRISGNGTTDTPDHYLVFYGCIEDNTEVTVSGKMIYYEKSGIYGPPLRSPLIPQVALAVTAISVIVFIIIGALILRRRARSGAHDAIKKSEKKKS